MLKDITDLPSQDFSKGLSTIQDIFKLAKEETPNCMDVKFDFDGKMQKRLGTNTMNAVPLSTSAGTLGVTTCGLGSFDFGATNIRWLVTQAGTALYASSDLGVNFVRVASDRSVTYQNFERSNNILICTSDDYKAPIYWTGSAGTFFTFMNVSAPLAKFCINFQGYTIFLNSSTRKRGFYYERDFLHLTGDFGADGNGAPFDIPSSEDDEITGAFILSNKLFVSTRYKLFAISYVGGNPDWAYREVKSWGFVPRTVDKVYFGDGEFAVGMDWNRRIRAFEGLEDKIISDKVENDNGMCEFATSKISYAGSGLVVSFGRTDDNEQVYKLGVTIGANSTQVTHFICLNGRTGALYPYDYSSLKLMSMTMAESGNRRFLVAVDQSGLIHLMDSGNVDRNTHAINDIVDSPVLFEKSPSQTSKSGKIDLFMSPNSAGRVFYQDRVDFDTTFNTRRIFNITSGGKIQHYESVDIPTTQNIYQWRLTSSSSTTTPWQLNRTDYFLKGLGIGREVPR